ncbi:hypothetical protein ADK47_27965 [Streptomyces rimosus subsp. rimosus]|nr:hypothetical protein ADK78_29490 [Kitasatospora aureofaciens]KOT33455.1 hypothetical protein ADK42_24275 [Streptomyces rimosus subsp. rimosus]KOT41551.1 hypothetical protein ADK84_11435 [Streptomyces sp. NRRL WC-3701]KOT54010.1 hypothetical protein ADK44_27945 [Streptomyces rimosus subsp. rimosus]KOT59643.1 hypothetical protein ADK45_21480 [Streptomyces rimosus subsp. rimosus]
MDITTSDLGQFGAPAETFCLITTEQYAEPLSLLPGDGCSRVLRLTLPPGARLGEVIERSVPEGAHVLAVCPGRFLDSPAERELGGRKLAVLPAGSTPLTGEQISYFLRTAARTDADRQARVAEEFFDRVGESRRLTIVDAASGTEAEFDHELGDCVWNQQAGVMEPGDQQIFPPGKLSVTAAEITTFAPDARLLGLNGDLTLRGWPIVHRHEDPADGPDQQRLFEALTPLVANAVTLHITAGSIEGVTPQTAAAAPAAAELDKLLTDDPRYRVIWELGFGINTTTEVIPANCGPNEVYGATGGVVNLGLGVTPATRFALAFLCPRSSLLTSDGTAVLGARKAVRRGRMQRISSAGCGCH